MNIFFPSSHNADKIEMVKSVRRQIMATKKETNGEKGFDLVAQMEADAAARSNVLTAYHFIRFLEGTGSHGLLQAYQHYNVLLHPDTAA